VLGQPTSSTGDAGMPRGVFGGCAPERAALQCHLYVLSPVVTTIDSTASYESGFSDIASATVSDGMPTDLHVSGIAVTVINKGKNWSGSAMVTILDANNAPASNATVNGQWTHEPLEGGSIDLNQVVGDTDVNGQLITTSSKLRALSGDSFRFTVNDISRGSDIYDPASSVETGAAVVP
jgi:hypothetical protein